MKKDFLINILRTIIFSMCAFIMTEIYSISKAVVRLEERQSNYVQFKLDINQKNNKKEIAINKNYDLIIENRDSIKDNSYRISIIEKFGGKNED